MARRSQSIKLVLFVAGILYLGYWLLETKHELDLGELLSDAHAGSDKPAIPRELCSFEECLHGRWKPRSPPFTSLAAFQDVFASNASTKWNRCAVVPPAEGESRTQAETDRLEQQRMVDVMNWVWIPYHGKMVQWDAEDFVVRLLQTPAGIIFIGDSISAAHEHEFGTILEQAGIRFTMEEEYLPFAKVNGLRQHILQPGHPLTLKLQRRAGVPDSRLRYPLFTIIEDHMLVHEDEIRMITKPAKDYYWYHDWKRVEGWEDYVRKITRPRAGEENSVKGETIIVVNTGAHWSRGELSMLPGRKSVAAEQAHLTTVYRQLVQLIVKKLSPIPRISVFYRSTTPGHPNCENKPRPYTNLVDALAGENNLADQIMAPFTDANERLIRRRWDWDMYNVHNVVWKDEIEGIERRRSVSGDATPKESEAKWRFLDFWEMSVQRPDAHSEPGRDCLHWCQPAVHTEWTYHIYHLMYLESLLDARD